MVHHDDAWRRGFAGAGSLMARYFTNVSDSGPIHHGRLPVSIGALKTQGKPMPIGMASTIGRTEAGLALW
jgi:hypothetical protein